MKRNDLILDVAGKIIISCCDASVSPMAFDKAQMIAEDVLTYLENTGVLAKEESCICPACGTEWVAGDPQKCSTVIRDEINKLELKLAKAREALAGFRNAVEDALLLDEALADSWGELKIASDKAYEALKDIE